jgi:succinate-acetate transporter protein
MAFAAFGVFWTVFLLAILAESFRVGEKTALQGPALDMMGMIPGVLGVLAALVIPFCYRLSMVEYVALVVGALACLPALILFGDELLMRIR